MPRKKVKLGKKYRDTVTGFEGTATSKHEYLNGCVRYNLEAEVTDPGKVPACITVDEEQLETVSGTKPAKTSRSGGDRPGPEARPEG